MLQDAAITEGSQHRIRNSSSGASISASSSSASLKHLERSGNRWAADVDFTIALPLDYNCDFNEDGAVCAHPSHGVETQAHDIVGLDGGKARKEVTEESPKHASEKQEAGYDLSLSQSVSHSSHVYSFDTEHHISEQPSAQEEVGQESAPEEGYHLRGRRMPLKTEEENFLEQEKESDDVLSTSGFSSPSCMNSAGVSQAPSRAPERPLSLAKSARYSETLFGRCSKKDITACRQEASSEALMSAAYSEGDAALLPCKASCSSWSGLKPGRSVAPSQEVASVYTRDRKSVV